MKKKKCYVPKVWVKMIMSEDRLLSNRIIFTTDHLDSSDVQL